MIETKEIAICSGVDSALDESRAMFHHMISYLDECSVNTKQDLLHCLPIITQSSTLHFEFWGYEFIPRSIITISSTFSLTPTISSILTYSRIRVFSHGRGWRGDWNQSTDIRVFRISTD